MLAITEVTSLHQAHAIAGTIGFPSKMPGTSYGIPASACKVGAKLARVEGSTCSNCYAMKGRYGIEGGSVEKSQSARLSSLDHPQWAEAMVYMLRKAHGLGGGKVHWKIKAAGFHRWHDSGDIQSIGHLAAICQVARRTPELMHWLPTREAGLLAAFLKAGGVIPGNLLVRVSATMVDGAASARFANTSTVHKNAEPVGHVCPAPKQGNQCGSCRACWSANVVNVSYHAH
jgi:hypothetical protein